MLAVQALIILYGSAIFAVTIFIAMTMVGISKKLESLHVDVWHQIYKDRI